jgi:hypothetical protein
LSADGWLSGALAPFLQRFLHPPLGQFRAIPQALVRQAGPVLASGQFRVNHRQGLAHLGGNFFRRPPSFPQFFYFLAISQGSKSIIRHVLTSKLAKKSGYTWPVGLV